MMLNVKVMAGDKVSAIADYYYASATGGSNTNMVTNVLASLTSLIGGPSTAGTLVHGNAANISSQLNGTTGFLNAVSPAGSGETTPQAYLTLIFFDERFNFIAAADGGVAQAQVASSVTAAGLQLSKLNIQAPKNGYVYAYLSNRSDQDVFFDNFKVTIQAGNIIEENHYYAFGLKIAAISSKKLGDLGEGSLKNTYLYNDKELFDDGDLNWLDYGFRNYDPQIGRFVQMDPLTDEYPILSPYQYAGNDPISNIDEDGLDVAGAIGGFADGAHDFSYAYSASSGMRQFISTGFQAVSAASTVNKAMDITALVASISSLVTQTAITVSNVINNQVATRQAGDGGGKWEAYLQMVAMRGALDALANANTLGLYDLFGGNHTNSYNTIDEKAAYLRGRLTGDAIAIGQGSAEFKGGGGAALATALETAGTGLVVGGAVALHGAGVGAVGTSDAVWTAAEMIKLGVTLKATSSKPSQTKLTGGNWHHIATDKHHTYWTPRLNKFFLGAELNIRTAKENIVYVFDHEGPHPDDYHEYVEQSLVKATTGKTPQTEDYRNAVIRTLEEIGKQAQTPGTWVNKLITK